MTERPTTSFLNARETFEQYENRSRPVSALSMNSVKAGPAHLSDVKTANLACEYRTAPSNSKPILFPYYQENPAMDNANSSQFDNRHEHDYRSAHQNPRITTYLPDSRKKKIPLALILTVSIGVPIFLIVCLFGAIWLQELGIL